MIIGIDASRAFLRRRTGIEEYSYQVIKHLRAVLSSEHQVILYVRKKLEIGNWKLEISAADIDFPVPKNWKIRALWAPRFWTQIGLSLEMFRQAPDVLFVPAHTIPIIHPKNTVVTIHGLEYEFCPKAYSWWSRFFLRLFTRYSCTAAKNIICVSENTKKDVRRLYNVPEEKLRVIYEGYDPSTKYQISNIKNTDQDGKNGEPYLLFIGRLEERKNIVRMLEAFEILKEKYHIPHRLVLAGKPGYGYLKIKDQISKSKNKEEIIELGYVSEGEKWRLLKNADVFLFPSLYEGFGLPVLEAQSAGIPVVTSNISSLPEVGGDGALYVDPFDSEALAESTCQLLSNKEHRGDIMKKAHQNLKRFSWGKTAREIGQYLVRSLP